MKEIYSREYRLTKPQEFQFVFQKARKIPSRDHTILVRENDLGHPRLGLIVSKKCSKLAVERNRFKRVVRERFRREKDRIGGFDVLVIARPGLAKKDNRRLDSALDKLWTALAA